VNAPDKIIKDSLAAAFVRAQKGFAPALKTSVNPHFKSRYVDLAGCVEAVIDSLNSNGLALIQHTAESESGVVVETVFLHESGESMSCGKLHVPASKQDAQGYGSALTYARRYSLMAACGIAPEDDDGNAATKRPQPAQIATAIDVDAKLLEQYREKAMMGMAALKAFHSMAKGESKTRVWAQHGNSLKAAADEADLAGTV